MDIISVFFILAVSVAGTSFLSHAIGYRRGKVSGRRDGYLRGKSRGRFEGAQAMRQLIDEHNERIGL